MAVVRVVAAAIVRDGRVLAARRGAGRRLAGCWELPGGKVEEGEGDRAALARELVEELGVAVAVHERLAECVHTYDFGGVRLVAYHCTLRGGATPHPHEHDAIRWLDADSLDDVGWAPADVPLLPAVRALLSATGAAGRRGSP